MTLAPIVLHHNERYGSLTVLRKLPSGKYLVGCACGWSKCAYRPQRLMRGRVTKCSRCRKQPEHTCKGSVGKQQEKT